MFGFTGMQIFFYGVGGLSALVLAIAIPAFYYRAYKEGNLWIGIGGR